MIRLRAHAPLPWYTATALSSSRSLCRTCSPGGRNEGPTADRGSSPLVGRDGVSLKASPVVARGGHVASGPADSRRGSGIETSPRVPGQPDLNDWPGGTSGQRQAHGDGLDCLDEAGNARRCRSVQRTSPPVQGVEPEQVPVAWDQERTNWLAGVASPYLVPGSPVD